MSFGKLSLSKIRTKIRTKFFPLYIAPVHSAGVYVYDQHSRINCCVAEYFLAKLRWCLSEQVCQGSQVCSALAFQRTGYCAIIDKNLPYLYLYMHVYKRMGVFAQESACLLTPTRGCTCVGNKYGLRPFFRFPYIRLFQLSFITIIYFQNIS